MSSESETRTIWIKLKVDLDDAPGFTAETITQAVWVGPPEPFWVVKDARGREVGIREDEFWEAADPNP